MVHGCAMPCASCASGATPKCAMEDSNPNKQGFQRPISLSHPFLPSSAERGGFLPSMQARRLSTEQIFRKHQPHASSHCESLEAQPAKVRLCRLRTQIPAPFFTSSVSRNVRKPPAEHSATPVHMRVPIQLERFFTPRMVCRQA
jgi:hypothetical protein